jgi:hypothetical protein
VIGMGVYTAKALLEGKGRDVWEMIWETFPNPYRASVERKTSARVDSLQPQPKENAP